MAEASLELEINELKMNEKVSLHARSCDYQRDQTQFLMDELEQILLHKGWPVPFTPYYLVHHEQMLSILDQLRLSLHDGWDDRFIQAFSPHPLESIPFHAPEEKLKKLKTQKHG